LVKRLSEAIRFKTLSLQETAHSNPDEFLQLHAFIDRSFPRLRQSLNKETVGRYSLLYTWPGKDKRLKPFLLMAHMDVVPVEAATESSWQQPPFSGQVADGFIWGRGAMDDRASVWAYSKPWNICSRAALSPVEPSIWFSDTMKKSAATTARQKSPDFYNPTVSSSNMCSTKD